MLSITQSFSCKVTTLNRSNLSVYATIIMSSEKAARVNHGRCSVDVMVVCSREIVRLIHKIFG